MRRTNPSRHGRWRRGHVDRGPTFATFAAEYVHARSRDIPASISRVRHAVSAASGVFGHVSIDRVGPSHIERFRTLRLESVAPGTVKRDLAVLHAMFQTAVRHGLRDDNPCTHVGVAKYQEAARRVLTQEEERRLLDAAASHLRPFIVVAINTGLRLSELTSLEWSDIDLSAGRIRLRATKSRKVQFVPINRLARAALLQIESATVGSGPVFTFRGQRLANPKKGIARAGERAGLEKVTCHVFRHTCATRLLMAGVDIRSVQAWLRHASITTTARYLHVSDLSGAAERLAAFNQAGSTPAAPAEEGEETDS